jgi:hypothetical protein
MQFCERLHQHAADEVFLHNILWTEEACFTREGVFNVLNSHLWAQDNPHAIRERGYQVRFSVSVWDGIVGDIVVGLYLLPDRLTAQRYRDFLETVLSGLLEYEPLAVRQKLWFQHDGAPAHYGEDVRQWLDVTTCILKTKRHRTYVAQYFRLVSSQGACARISFHSVFTHTHTHTGVRKLTLKILEVVSLTKSKTEMSCDEMPFDAPVSNKTFLNLKNVTTSCF